MLAQEQQRPRHSASKRARNARRPSKYAIQTLRVHGYITFLLLSLTSIMLFHLRVLLTAWSAAHTEDYGRLAADAVCFSRILPPTGSPRISEAARYVLYVTRSLDQHTPERTPALLHGRYVLSSNARVCSSTRWLAPVLPRSPTPGKCTIFGTP